MSWYLSKLRSVSEITEAAPAEKFQKAIEKPAEQPRAYTSYYNVMSPVLEYLRSSEVQQDILMRYRDYNDMGEYPLLVTALDIYADDSTKVDIHTGNSVWVKSEDKKIENELNELLSKRIKVEQKVWSIARTLAQYGNDFSEVLYTEDGVVDLNLVPVRTMRRIQEANGTLIGHAQQLAVDGMVDLQAFKRSLNVLREQRKKGESSNVIQPTSDGQGNRGAFIPFEPWDMIHFRVGYTHGGAYGSSILDAARWSWRRLVLLEDAAIVYKITRSPAKWAFYIDTTGVAPNAVGAWLEKAKNAFTGKKFIGPDGKLDFKNHPLGQQDTYFIPSNGGKNATQIEMLSGADSQAIDDLEYFRSQMIAAIKVPRAYLGLEDGDARSSLAQLDIRFAATTGRLQREMVNGFTEICRNHLTILGIDPDSSEWTVHMTPPSSINELAQIETQSAKVQLALSLMDLLPKDRLLSEILGYAEDDVKKIMAGKKKEMKEQADFDQGIQNAAMEAQAAMYAGEEGATESIRFKRARNSLDERVNQSILNELRRTGDLERIQRDIADGKDMKKVRSEIGELRKEFRRGMLLMRKQK